MRERRSGQPETAYAGYRDARFLAKQTAHIVEQIRMWRRNQNAGEPISRCRPNARNPLLINNDVGGMETVGEMRLSSIHTYYTGTPRPTGKTIAGSRLKREEIWRH
jgi:hypothetical protein